MSGSNLPNDNRPLVCVVDDELSIRESLSSLLRSAGLNVQTFPSAEEFLSNARFEALRCLMLDVQLPGITGLDLQQKLVTREIKIPIIFLTGHGDIPMSVRAVKAGAVEFLTKPFDDEYLLEAVRSAVARYTSSQRNPEGNAQENLGGFSRTEGPSNALRHEPEIIMSLRRIEVAKAACVRCYLLTCAQEMKRASGVGERIL